LGRRAVAATLVAFVIFTSLLLANSAIYSADNSGLGAAVLSTAQVRERVYGTILTGLAAYDSLAVTQDYLQSNPLDCSSPQPYLDSIAGSQQEKGTDGGITYTTDASWTYLQVPVTEAGSALLSRYGGYSAGDMNLEVTTLVDESYDGGLPSYSIQNSETVHLPVPIVSTISLCLTALSDLRGALSSLSHCNSSAVDAALALAESSYPVLGSFTVGASASSLSSGGCSVDYWVTTTLGGLEGVSGTFQWTVQGAGSLST
jgi:hypothetical protein